MNVPCIPTGTTFVLVFKAIYAAPFCTFAPFAKVKLNYGKPLDYTNNEPKNPKKEDIEKATKEIMDSIIMLTNQAK